MYQRRARMEVNRLQKRRRQTQHRCRRGYQGRRGNRGCVEIEEALPSSIKTIAETEEKSTCPWRSRQRRARVGVAVEMRRIAEASRSEGGRRQEDETFRALGSRCGRSVSSKDVAHQSTAKARNQRNE